MQFLKVLVVVMGLLIVAGVVTLAVAIGQRLGGGSTTAFAERALAVPEGARVVAAVPGDGRIAIQIAMPDGSTRVELLDMRSGKSTGAIAITPEPPR